MYHCGCGFSDGRIPESMTEVQNLVDVSLPGELSRSLAARIGHVTRGFL